MKTLRGLGGCSLVAFALVAGVFSFPGCDSGPKEGSAPPMNTGPGMAGKNAGMNKLITGGSGKISDPSGKTKVASPGAGAEAK